MDENNVFLTECKVCGGKLANIALFCPHCGAPNSLNSVQNDSRLTISSGESKKPKYKRRKDNRLETTISTGKYDENGKQIIIHVYGNTITELNKKKEEIRVAIRNGTYADDKGNTVKTYGIFWKSIYYPNDNNVSNIFKNHLKDIEDIRLKDLTRSDIQKCINMLDGHYDLQRRIKMYMNQMLGCAIDDGLIYKNVCNGGSQKTSVKLPKKPKKEKRALYDYEIAAIKKAMTLFNDKERNFVKCLYYLGTRRAETVMLMKNVFDFKNDRIHIDKAVTWNNNQPDMNKTDTKTFSGERWLDIVPSFKADIKSYIDSIDSLYLFPNKNGGLMSETSFKRFWDGIMRKINISAGGSQHYDNKKRKWIIDKNAVIGLTPHIFRHNFATNLYYSDIDIKEAVRLMGHSDSKMIIEIYAHLDKKKSKSKEKIQKVLKVI